MARRTAHALPPWPLTNTMPAYGAVSGSGSAERPNSTSTVVSASVPIDSVPGNAWCSPDEP